MIEQSPTVYNSRYGSVDNTRVSHSGPNGLTFTEGVSRTTRCSKPDRGEATWTRPHGIFTAPGGERSYYPCRADQTVIKRAPSLPTIVVNYPIRASVTECLRPPTIPMWKPNPQGDGIRRWGLWRWLEVTRGEPPRWDQCP